MSFFGRARGEPRLLALAFAFDKLPRRESRHASCQRLTLPDPCYVEPGTPSICLKRLSWLWQYRVSNKTLRISKVFGIEGKKLLKPEDDYEALRDFTHPYGTGEDAEALRDFERAYLGALTPLEQMNLEFQKLLADTPGLQQRLDRLPGRVFSGKEHTKPGAKALFLCYALPAEDKSQCGAGVSPAGSAGVPPASPSETANWTTEAGKAGWYLYDLATGKILEQPKEIVAFVRSTPETPRHVNLPQTELHDVRLKVEKHIKNTYLKQVQAPVGVKPVLKCWMELG